MKPEASQSPVVLDYAPPPPATAEQQSRVTEQVGSTTFEILGEIAWYVPDLLIEGVGSVIENLTP